jgi:hypothetical protein
MKECLLFLWMIMTLILAFSLVGLILFIPKDTYTTGPSGPSTWMHVGRSLLDAVVNNK